jgi:hypothetical protein
MDYAKESLGSTALTDSQSMLPPPAKPRKKKAPTLRESDWVPHQTRITELYSSGLPLKEVMKVIEEETGFSAEYVYLRPHSPVNNGE